MRKIATIAVLVLLVAAVAVWSDTWKAPEPVVVPATPTSGAHAVDGTAAPAPTAKQQPKSMAITVPGVAQAPADLQARDARRRAAVAPLQGELLQALDKCLPGAAGPRMPQRLILRFERAAAADPGHERFVISAVEPVGVAPGQPSPQQSPAWACFAGLTGRPLDIPVGPGTQESKFSEVVAFPLPTSIGWNGQTPPSQQMP